MNQEKRFGLADGRLMTPQSVDDLTLLHKYSDSVHDDSKETASSVVWDIRFNTDAEQAANRVNNRIYDDDYFGY